MRGTVAKKLRAIANGVADKEATFKNKSHGIFVLDDVTTATGEVKKDWVEKTFVTVQHHPLSARGQYQRLKAEFKNV